MAFIPKFLIVTGLAMMGTGVVLIMRGIEQTREDEDSSGDSWWKRKKLSVCVKLVAEDRNTVKQLIDVEGKELKTIVWANFTVKNQSVRAFRFWNSATLKEKEVYGAGTGKWRSVTGEHLSELKVSKAYGEVELQSHGSQTRQIAPLSDLDIAKCRLELATWKNTWDETIQTLKRCRETSGANFFREDHMVTHGDWHAFYLSEDSKYIFGGRVLEVQQREGTPKLVDTNGNVNFSC